MNRSVLPTLLAALALSPVLAVPAIAQPAATDSSGAGQFIDTLANSAFATLKTVGGGKVTPAQRAKFRSLLNLGFTDAIRQIHGDEPGLYSFWDYQAGAWQRNNGIRIDHLLLSPQAADLLKTAHIDREVRTQEKPSDHVPVVIELKSSRE